jgi:hypothetical protein
MNSQILDIYKDYIELNELNEKFKNRSLTKKQFKYFINKKKKLNYKSNIISSIRGNVINKPVKVFSEEKLSDEYIKQNNINMGIKNKS